MSTQQRIKSIANPRLFPPSLESSARSPRKKALDPMVRRMFIKNQMSNEPKTPEALEFLTPEYLDQQRRALKLEISNIQKELLPLKQQYEKLKLAEEPPSPVGSPTQQNNSPRSPRSNAGDYSLESPRFNENKHIDFAQMVKQSQIEYEEACSQIAQLRRIYCEANKLRLEDQIQEYQDEIEDFRKSLNDSTYKLNNVVSQLDQITSSEETSRIIEQQDKIAELRDEYNRLLDIEDEYIKKNDDMLDEQPQYITLANKAEQLKKKLSTIKYNLSTKKVELGKKRKMYDQRIKDLQEAVNEAKRKQKQKKVKKIFLYGVTAEYEEPRTNHQPTPPPPKQVKNHPEEEEIVEYEYYYSDDEEKEK